MFAKSHNWTPATVRDLTPAEVHSIIHDPDQPPDGFGEIEQGGIPFTAENIAEIFKS